MEKVKINDICNISNGYAFKSDKYISENGARVIRITNVQKGKIVDNDPKLYPFSELNKLDAYKIFEGDILMSLTGNVGRVGRYPKELLPAYINQRVCRVMPKNEKLDTNFLFHFLNSDVFENEAIKNSAGAAQLNLSTKWLGDFEIPLPSLATQQRIAAILDQADAIIQNNRAIVQKYDALTQSLFLDMFGDPVKNEKGWEKRKLNDFLEVLVDVGSNGGNDWVSANIKMKDEEDYALMIRTVNLNKNDFENNLKYVSEETYNLFKKTKVYGGEIIMNKIGSAGEFWLMPYLNRPVSLGLNQLMMKFRNLDKFFFYFYFSTNYGKKLINSKLNGATTKSITKTALRDLDILYPPMELQNQFAERVALIESQKQQAQLELAKSEELFQSLLQRAFKGELN